MKNIIFKLFLFIILLIIVSQMYINFKTPKSIGVSENTFSPLKDSPNGVSTQSRDSEKYVAPLEFQENLQVSKKILKKIILNQDGTKLISESQNYMHFTFTSNFFHFKDDLELYFDQLNGLIHFKSQSRIGYSDLGVNKKRYELIKKLYLSIKK